MEPVLQGGQGPMGGKGFKLDLDNINRSGQMDYHEEFYSKID